MGRVYQVLTLGVQGEDSQNWIVTERGRGPKFGLFCRLDVNPQ